MPSRSARSIHLERRKVLKGALDKSGTLKKSQLKLSKQGVVVSKAKSKSAKENFAGSPLQMYNKAVKQAKRSMGIRKGDPFEKHLVKGALKRKADMLYEGMQGGGSAKRRSRRRSSAR